MSTDDERPEGPAVPRTRAEMRAAREAAAAVEAAEEESRGGALRPAQGAGSEAPAEVPEPPVPERAERDEGPARRASFEPSLSSEGDPSSPRSAPVPERAQRPSSRRSAPRSGTDGGRSASEATPKRSRRFGIALAAVLGILVLVGAGLGVVSLTQGPRITEVQVDPAHAIDASGSRLILTANQSLAAIDPAQVTVEPSVPFTVDAAGRGIGIRFTVPLDDETEYTVTVADATGASGGPKNDLTTTFATPPSSIFLLNRSDKEDKIFQTDLTGENGVPVFAADKINDFRATSSQLVVTVEEDDGSHILVMDHDGGNQRELPLPGEGYVGSIQVSERGGLVGYSYSDRELSDTEGRASVLVTQSLNDKDSEPQVIEVGDTEASIFAWQFVPDSAAVLFIDFDGALSLVDRSSDAGVQSLGLAANIQGISRGTYTAIVERLDGTVVELNLADGSEQPLAASNPDYGIASTITPFPGGTLRHVVQRNDLGIPTGQAVVKVDDDGTASPLIEVPSTDSILQACASPSGQYAAVVIAPNMTDNPYDEMLLPLPKRLETHLIDLRTGDAMPVLTGFDASWCQTAPRF
ncbi:hypothetical protein KV396_05675 [Microbacterium galbinum]|uniref:SbsA Ig-like domain-containing protein n=1 Tax=Microbacterium galbinum TaxID=2851646 RepID=A0ABY4IMN6_9MICO|nr:hypothetical protein KV396_05675 [Microbacterium galbinum]